MKTMFNLLLLAFICTASTCKKDDGHNIIIVRNNTNDSIVCQEIWQGIIKPDDTLYRCRKGGIRILPKNQIDMESGDQTWEEDFKIIPYIQFLIVKDSVYSNVPCDTISKYNMVLYRYQLTLQDLQRMNWVVEYPPKD